jgi:hypothetical protein
MIMPGAHDGKRPVFATTVIFFSLDRAYRYTSFARAHAQTMQRIWGATIEIGTCMLNVIGDEADRQKAKANFDAALAGENILKEEEYDDAGNITGLTGAGDVHLRALRRDVQPRNPTSLSLAVAKPYTPRRLHAEAPPSDCPFCPPASS